MLSYGWTPFWFGLFFILILVLSCFPFIYITPVLFWFFFPTTSPPPLLSLPFPSVILFFFFSLFSSLTCPCTQQPDYRDQSEPEIKSHTEENRLSDITEPRNEENCNLEHAEKEANASVSHSKSSTRCQDNHTL